MYTDNIAQYIDHTLLKPDTMLGDYTQAYRDACQYQFKSICVNSGLIPLMSNIMFSNPKNTISLCSTIGFPHGTSLTDSKLLEINQGIRRGVTEFDVVPLLSAIKSQDWNHFEKEIAQLRDASKGFILKVILEVGLLQLDEIKHCCDICVNLGVDFVKTSTGFAKQLDPVDTANYVKFMADCVKESKTQVKASGWIRTLADCKLMIDAGATRIGCSGSVKIMQEFEQQNGR